MLQPTGLSFRWGCINVAVCCRTWRYYWCAALDLAGVSAQVQPQGERTHASWNKKHSTDSLVVFALCLLLLKMTPDSLVYSTNLYYNSSAENNPFILRTDPAVIPIECCYPSWSPVEGTSNICSCCAIGTVGHLKDNPEDVSLCIDPGREMSSSHYQHSRNFPENKTRVTQMDHRV
ncbi:zona pellucida sperm-binding protein 3-like isoform X1 [Dermochelys coriacea]|uniref:zona pellucida sperm-binding protein 3-like isoform X1 n=1 Tax=Dermochelys coriacea TaxID=27794 RepID=UPI001CA7DB4E|nr:zona pellucida sperm-binding protein 3-like isoform X1 [Dermochelys coriacea]